MRRIGKDSAKAWRNEAYVQVGNDEVLLCHVQCRRCKEWPNHEKRTKAMCGLLKKKVAYNYRCQFFTTASAEDFIEIVLMTLRSQGSLKKIIDNGVTKWGLPEWDKQIV